MGLLGSLAEKLAASAIGSATGGNAQAAGAQQQNAINSVLGMLNHPSIGGVAGLTSMFENAGLGHIIAGWTSNGPNPAISAGQLQQVLGSDKIAAFAAKLGIPEDQAASHLAEMLPHVIDHLTPNGTVPTGPINIESAAAELKSKLFG
jgi:uncharacterized protein YidB (DUF937 family)